MADTDASYSSRMFRCGPYSSIFGAFQRSDALLRIHEHDCSMVASPNPAGRVADDARHALLGNNWITRALMSKIIIHRFLFWAVDCSLLRVTRQVSGRSKYSASAPTYLDPGMHFLDLSNVRSRNADAKRYRFEVME